MYFDYDSELYWFFEGFYDFAGSGVVHLGGGTCALIGALILGPRLDRFNENVDSSYFQAHNMPHISLGGFILVAGFMAFNGGSQLSISQPGKTLTQLKTCLNLD